MHVLNWKGYGADEPWAIEAFEKATGHKVVNDFFNSEQEMLTKLRTNPGLYDVVMINAAFTGQALAENLIQPIDTSKIANYADISPEKAGSPMLNQDGKVFGVPWVWGLTAIAINDKSFETPADQHLGHVGRGAQGPRRHPRRCRRGDPVRRHRLRPEHQRHQGHGGGQGEAHLADAADPHLLELGERLEPDGGVEPDRRRHLLVAARPTAPRRSSSCRSRWSSREEGAVAWLDAFSIPAGSKNVDGAEAFINYMIDPGFYVEWVTKVGAPVSANAKAVAALPEDSFNRKVMGDPEGGRAHPVPGADHRRPARAVSGALAGAEGEREVTRVGLSREQQACACSCRMAPARPSGRAPPSAGPTGGKVMAALTAGRRGIGPALPLLAPAYLWLTVAIFLPLSAMAFFSFMTDLPLSGKEWSLTLQNYAAFFSTGLY